MGCPRLLSRDQLAVYPTATPRRPISIDFNRGGARDFYVHVQIICHPSKVDSRSRGQRPVLEDIAGSKHWDNKCDLGLCIHRPKVFEKGERKTEAYLYVLKSRYDELGYPCKLEVDYDLNAGRFKATDYRMPYE